MYLPLAEITDPRGTVTVGRHPFGSLLGNRPDWRTYAEIAPAEGEKQEFLTIRKLLRYLKQEGYSASTITEVHRYWGIL